MIDVMKLKKGCKKREAKKGCEEFLLTCLFAYLLASLFAYLLGLLDTYLLTCFLSARFYQRASIGSFLKYLLDFLIQELVIR